MDGLHLAFDDRTSTSTDGSAQRASAGAGCNSVQPVEEEFFEGELLYLAALETLWIAYLQPLSNASPKKRLEVTFGSDVLAMIACHKLIIAQLSRPVKAHSSETSIRTSANGEDDLVAPRPLGASTHVMDDSTTSDSGWSAQGSPTTTVSNNSAVQADGSSSGGGGESTLDFQSFPSVLLGMTPTMESAYTNYVVNFTANLEAAEAARQSVSSSLWKTSYVTLAQLTFHEKLRPWLNRHGPSATARRCSLESLMVTFDLSFSALVALPVQRLARYSLLIQEWVRCQQDENPESNDDAQRRQADGPSAEVGGGSNPDDAARQVTSRRSVDMSPFRRCRVTQHAEAISAAQRLSHICSSVNQIQSHIAATQRLVVLERKLGVGGGSLSQFTGRRIVHESRLTKAKCKGKGVWHMKPCHAVLLDKLLLVVECFDVQRTKFKRLFKLPTVALQEVRRLASSPTISRELEGRSGFILRCLMSQTKPSHHHGFLRRLSHGGTPTAHPASFSSSPEPSTGSGAHSSPVPRYEVEELVFVDDDELNCGVWVSELSMQVQQEHDDALA